MKQTLVDLLIEKRKREAKYFQNYLNYGKKIKEAAERLLGKVKVLVFGSVVRKETGPGSDIDVLVISSKLNTTQKKSEIRIEILKEIGFSAPFEIHLITPNEYRDWYSHFIKEKIEI